MTLDQIFMLLADKKILRKGDVDGRRTVRVPSAAGVAGGDGAVRAVDAEGNRIKLRKSGGRSLASVLNEKEEEKKTKKRRRRRGKNRGN